jgi:6-phosphogluconolactonase
MEAAVISSTHPQVRVLRDLEAVSLAAAGLVSSIAEGAIAGKGRFAVALSGGATPRRLYSILGAAPFRERIGWEKVHLFWADERCVPVDHNESNYRLVAGTLLRRVDLPKDQVHRIRGEEEPERAAREYEEDIRLFFGPAAAPVFDLVLLGAGEDGHTASLLPGSPAVREKKRLVVPVYREPPKHSRITLTLPALNQASHILFLASGHAKAAVVHEILEDGNPKQYPAGLVRPVNGTITWMIDREAAALLADQLGS